MLSGPDIWHTRPMRPEEVTPTILQLCRDRSLGFHARSEALLGQVGNLGTRLLLDHLDKAGVIPECFGHDSTEEKLFAKYCDSLLAQALAAIGMDAEIILERADSADVIAKCEGYTVVGDAKAFRLSRTAKNQKDFKVEALDKWRKGAEYACLICPLYQYPAFSSQIYLQATRYNVTLLSYTHLAFLLRNRPFPVSRLEKLWELGTSVAESKDARKYWAAVEEATCEIGGVGKAEWTDAVKATLAALPAQAEEQVKFWESEKQRVMALTREAATAALVKSMKIDGKIAVIKRNFREMERTTEEFER